MTDHFADSDGVGAIFPPIIYTVISLRCLGYADDSPEMNWALAQLDELMMEERDTLRVQPCFSPVWDTALSLNALAMAGMRGPDPAVGQGGALAPRPRSAPARRLESAQSCTWSRAAGSSSIATASIRTSTIRRWC